MGTSTVNRKNSRSNTSAAKPKHMARRFLITVFILFVFFVSTGIFLLYGPFSYFRNLWVTTAMSTLHHQWLATDLFDSGTIADIMAHNKVVEPTAGTNPNAVNVNNRDVADNATELPTSASQGERIINGIGFTRLRTASYDGWVIRVFDPARISMSLAQSYGSCGEQVSHMVKRLGAFAGLNAGGFIDVNGHGNGGKADKVLISKGKLIARGNYGDVHDMIGFDRSDRLLLEHCAQSQVTSLTSTYRDAVEFSPFLIVNGTPSTMQGNGGYGIQPRTAIGQTKNGVVLFVEIDGRSSTSIGCSVKELQNIFIRYDAYNAANLDGGASSVVVYKGRVINRPSSSAGERYVPDAFLISTK